MIIVYRISRENLSTRENEDWGYFWWNSFVKYQCNINHFSCLPPSTLVCTNPQFINFIVGKTFSAHILVYFLDILNKLRKQTCKSKILVMFTHKSKFTNSHKKISNFTFTPFFTHSCVKKFHLMFSRQKKVPFTEGAPFITLNSCKSYLADPSV